VAREPFTDDQWQQLQEAGPAIARAVAAAAGSAGQTEAELESFLRLVDRTQTDSTDPELLGQLISEVHTLIAAGSLAAPTEDAIADGIHAARRAGAVLAVVADEQDARAVRLWLLDVARTVAQAAREGGILGLRSEDVSGPERETIAAISDALGLSESTESTEPTEPAFDQM
jgi:hypothetical protein